MQRSAIARGIALASALLASFAGCAAVVGIGDLPAPQGDAGSALDATSEVGSADARVDDRDGGGDATALCQPDAHLLCDDFDHGSLEQSAIWSKRQMGGAVALTTELASSPPNAVDSRLDARHVDAGTAPAAVGLQAIVPGTFQRLSCELDFRFEALANGTNVLSIDLSSGTSPNETIELTVTDTGTVLFDTVFVDGGFQQKNQGGAAVPLQKWIHLGLSVDVGAARATKIRIGGADWVSLATVATGTASATLFFGGELTEDPVEDARRILFDNVVCDVVR